MKSLVEFLAQVLQDCSILCGANPILDLRTIERRVKDEGNSFLTITLPSFSTGFELALSRGCLSPALFPGFRVRRGTCLPRFLGGFMERIFDSRGVLLNEASSDCVFAIRQICLFAKKIELPCTLRRTRSAERRFVEVETELKSSPIDSVWLHRFRGVASIVWSDLLRDVDVSTFYRGLRPRHGPGRTADDQFGNDKYRFRSWFHRLESEFPFTEFGIGSILNPVEEALCSLKSSAPRDELPVKVCFVPKTMKSPRVIAEEPVCMQYMQQALASELKRLVEHQSSYMSRRVNFSRQDVNARLALSSSKSGRLATIDLSDASDRVSTILVRDMLKSVPWLSRMVFACRSTRARLPSGKIIPLRKFASMGSALCFPIEAVTFFIVIVTGRLARAGVRATPKSVRKHSRELFIYGDDIVVPAVEASLTCEDLEAFGLRVNRSKSFWTGKFRESCGVDAYDGRDVTPTYLRREFPTSKANVKGLLSTVALANQLYSAGLWQSCRYVRKKVENLLGELPAVGHSTSRLIERMARGRHDLLREYPGLGWSSFSNAESFDGWDDALQCLKSKRWVVSPKRSSDPLDGDAALLKCFGLVGRIMDYDDPLGYLSPSNSDNRHLLTSVRSGNLALKRRWTSL